MVAPTKRRMHFMYYFGRGLISFLMLIFAAWKVKGKENCPKDTPVLAVCNHLHIADPPIVAASLPMKLKIMAKEDLWRHWFSRFYVSNFGAFPVRRGAIDTEAIRNSHRALQEGFSLLMFPEGARSPKSQLIAAQPGAALIAARVNVPILPVCITGSQYLKRLGWCFFHRPRITVTIGRPFNLPPHNGRPTREQRQELTGYIMNKVAELLPPEYRGVYAAEK